MQEQEEPRDSFFRGFFRARLSTPGCFPHLGPWGRMTMMMGGEPPLSPSRSPLRSHMPCRHKMGAGNLKEGEPLPDGDA